MTLPGAAGANAFNPPDPGRPTGVARRIRNAAAGTFGMIGRTLLARPRLALLGLACLAAGAAHAQSSLGIGVNDGGVPPASGVLGHLMNWINLHQQQFYRALTGAMKAMRDSRGQMLWMVALSFLYGVFHAAGPGHGKAVIASYMLANEVTLRRGIVLSFVSAFLQAGTAILMMTALFLVLRGSAVNMTNATHVLEVASYGLITLFGAWLLWRKAGPRFVSMFAGRPATSLSAAVFDAHDDRHVHSAACGHAHHNHAHAHAPTARSAVQVCTECGHAHAPDPSMLAGEKFNWRTAWAAVAAVGLRPCSGALIVLSFAFLNGLYAGGVLSVLAMALGTAITVSALATLAVTAKDWAVRLAGDGRAGNRIHAAIEIGGAALVFLLGLALLSASLAG